MFPAANLGQEYSKQVFVCVYMVWAAVRILMHGSQTASMQMSCFGL